MSTLKYKEFICLIQLTQIELIKSTIESINFKKLNDTIGECGILLYALEIDNLEILDLLLSADDINAGYTFDNKSWTPLMFCAEYGQVNEFQMILNTGKGKLNYVNYLGESALNIAKSNKNSIKQEINKLKINETTKEFILRNALKKYSEIIYCNVVE